MAVSTGQVPLYRLAHTSFSPLVPGTPTTVAARCDCGATWCQHAGDPRHPSFAQWAMTHIGPRCPGSGGLVHEGNTTNGTVRCPDCGLVHETSPAAGYDGWRYLVTHVVVPS